MLSPSTTFSLFFFFNDTATTEIYTLSLHDALPISIRPGLSLCGRSSPFYRVQPASGGSGHLRPNRLRGGGGGRLSRGDHHRGQHPPALLIPVVGLRSNTGPVAQFCWVDLIRVGDAG